MRSELEQDGADDLDPSASQRQKMSLFPLLLQAETRDGSREQEEQHPSATIMTRIRSKPVK